MNKYPAFWFFTWLLVGIVLCNLPVAIPGLWDGVLVTVRPTNLLNGTPGLSATVIATANPSLTPDNSILPCRAAAGVPFDIAIPDGTRLRPAASFTKTWRLVNTGECTWTRDFAIVWFAGDDFDSSHIQYLRDNVKPKQSIDISLEMVSPTKPGMYQSYWKLRNAQGELFGIGPNATSPFWARIEVIETRTLTPSPTALPTATQAILARGKMVLFFSTFLDLDSGQVREESADILLSSSEIVPLGFWLKNDAQMVNVGRQSPKIEDCRKAVLEPGVINLEKLVAQDVYLCYRTSESFPGYLHLLKVDLVARQVEVEFFTWAVP